MKIFSIIFVLFLYSFTYFPKPSLKENIYSISSQCIYESIIFNEDKWVIDKEKFEEYFKKMFLLEASSLKIKSYELLFKYGEMSKKEFVTIIAYYNFNNKESKEEVTLLLKR